MGFADKLAAFGTGTHAALYKLFDGRGMGAKEEPGGIVVVTTTGRKTGKKRSRPLMHLKDGDNIVVVASAAGSDSHPSWYLNMLADPEVEVQVGEHVGTFRARAAAEPERTELYARFEAVEDNFTDYVGRTDRVIPVVVLEPA